MNESDECGRLARENEALRALLLDLVQSVERDLNGVDGMPLSGNGGLVSEMTWEHAKRARVLVMRLVSEQRSRAARGYVDSGDT